MFKKLIDQFINLYALWIVASAVLGYAFPSWFSWFTGNYIVAALALVMLGMGLTLKLSDFKAIVSLRKAVIIGIVLQYSAMPVIAWTIARLMQLTPELTVGLIIVGCCPAGKASNVLAYVGRGNLALSIVITSLSTFISTMLTPVLAEVYAGAYLPIDGWGMFFTSVKAVLLPVLAGVLLNTFFPAITKKVASAGPFVSVWAIVFITGSIVAQSADMVSKYAGSLFAAAMLLHGTGFALGYAIATLFKLNPANSRTVSIEVGVQNGGLAAVLAKENFPLQPIVAVPSVFCSVSQTIIGGFLASFWRWRYRHEDEAAKHPKEQTGNEQA